MEQTEKSQRESGGGGREEINKELICMCALPMDSRAVKAWGRPGTGWKETRGKKRGDISDTLNNKDFKKNIQY